MTTTDGTCPECVIGGRRGYCAPLRCYCGHETCHAFASWRPLAPPDDVAPTKAGRNDWSNRKESTWIDKM